jgi:signal transduction histidine kinase
VAVKFAQIMKRKLSVLSGRYLAALRTHLKQRSRPNAEPAGRLGRQAVTLGLETLDVARIHERALATLGASGAKDGIMERADLFFTEVISPIEESHHAALEANARLDQANKTLRQRTLDLAASNRSLKQGIALRKTAEAALMKSVEHYKDLLKKSLPVRKHLQELTHRILSAQENSRSRMSHELQDEIAQTLLGINVRLLTVKRAAGLNDQSLQKEIASTQRMVGQSVQSINRFAHELERRPPA